MTELERLIQEEVAKQKEPKLSIADALKMRIGKINPKVCLLIDVSGSMSGDYGRLCDIVSKVPKVRRFAFSWGCKEIPFGKPIPTPNGTTAMDIGFNVCKLAGITHTVIITDGEPDSESRALHASKGLKVDIIYVGPEPVPEFLRRLANMRGGKFDNVDIGSLEVEGKITALLGPGGDTCINL
jgi:hypothetical protein